MGRGLNSQAFPSARKEMRAMRAGTVQPAAGKAHGASREKHTQHQQFLIRPRSLWRTVYSLLQSRVTREKLHNWSVKSTPLHALGLTQVKPLLALSGWASQAHNLPTLLLPYVSFPYNACYQPTVFGSVLCFLWWQEDGAFNILHTSSAPYQTLPYPM